MIDFTIKPDRLDKETIENAIKHEAFIKDLDYLIEEGFVQVEEGEDGNIRVYPA